MTDLRCPECGYEWDYGGKLSVATCPNCTRKLSVEANGVDSP